MSTLPPPENINVKYSSLQAQDKIILFFKVRTYDTFNNHNNISDEKAPRFIILRHSL